MDKDTPKVGDTVRVVLEGKVTRTPNDILALKTGDEESSLDATLWHVSENDAVKSIEILKPAKPSVKDLPMGSVIRDADGVVSIKRQDGSWRGTDGGMYDAAWAHKLDELGWTLLVPQESA